MTATAAGVTPAECGLGEPDRAAFEAWYSNDGTWPAALERSGPDYKLAQTQAAWESWRACWPIAVEHGKQLPLLNAKG